MFFVGENGQGKTNFLEAVYYLCYGTSFRTRNDRIIVRQGRKNFAVEGRYKDPFSYDSHIFIKYEDGKKTIFKDEKQISDRRALVESIPCVLFSHEDIQFVNGAPERQRWFIDQTLSLHQINYLDVLRKYRAILKTRNQVIKDRRSDLLPLYDFQLSKAGWEIQEYRKELITLFNTGFSKIFRAISGIKPELTLAYRPSWKNAGSSSQAQDILERTREQDLAQQTTTTGPHRDKLYYVLEGRNFVKIASTGQLRLLSLILRISQARFIAENAEKTPILLLDDVLLELDNKRRERFFHFLPKYDQAFFTFLPDEPYHKYKQENTKIFFVSQGKMRGEHSAS
ncbi:MAG: DNA replication/repair protein RecF [Spirochaetia bacterium]